MDYQIVWTQTALDALEGIVTFLSESSPQAAEKTRLKLLSHVEILERFPEIGPVYAPDPNGETRQIVCRPYRIFYRVDDASQRVEVHTVWHGSRKEPELPGGPN